MRKLSILFLVLATALIPFVAIAQDDVIGGDEAALRLLLQRIYDQRTSYDLTNNATIYVGEMPPEMEYVIPFPDEAVVVGSIVFTGGYDDGSREIYVDTSMSPEDVLAFYEGDLPDGFYVPDGAEDYMNTGGGGFAPNAVVENFPLCFNEESGMMIFAYEIDTGSALNIRTFPESQMPPFCDPGFNPTTGFAPQVHTMLPNLTPPEGVNKRPEGGGGGPDFAESGALITANEDSDMAVEDVLAHYEAQLMDDGWEQVASSAAPMGGWSTWTLTDEEADETYSSTLTVVTLPGEDNRFAARVTVRGIDE